MKKKIFGNNIQPDCKYCKNMIADLDTMNCSKKRDLINGVCKKFEYNPLLRVPKEKPQMMKFSKEDFML